MENKSNMLGVPAGRNRGFSLIDLLLAMAIAMVVLVFVVAIGWGLAFAFSGNVLVPFLAVPAEWVWAVTIVLSLLLTGVFSAITFIAGLLGLAGLSALLKRKGR